MGDNIAADEVVVERGRSWRGLHSAHLMRMGGTIDVESRIQEVLEAGGQVEAFYLYEEKELGVSHLWLYWKMPGEELPNVTVTAQKVEFSGKVYAEMEEKW